MRNRASNLTILYLLITFFPLKLLACFNAELHKIYPIGILNDTIISIDMHISRTDAVILSDTIKGNVINESKKRDQLQNFEMGWIIKTSLSKYDKSQNLLEYIPLDSARFYTLNQGIIENLKILYNRGYNYVIQHNKSIELFTPVNISYCDYSIKCKNITNSSLNNILDRKEINNLISLIGEKFNLNISSLEGDILNILSQAFNSVRKFTSSQFDLIVVNLQLGEISNKEISPQIAFDDIKSAIYEEVLLYHGEGYDVFFTRDQ